MKTCLDCVEYTWNKEKFDKCTGKKQYSIAPCKKFTPITKKEAQKRLKVLGIPGVK